MPYVSLSWQHPTGSSIEITEHELAEAGIDPEDHDAIEEWVKQQFKNSETRGYWVSRAHDEWTDRADGDFEVIQFDGVSD